jgi:hypothetical protein
MDSDDGLIHRITGFLVFVHRPEFEILENTAFRKLDLFPSSGEERETSTLWVPFTELTSITGAILNVNRLGLFLTSPEDGNISSFRNIEFSDEWRLLGCYAVWLLQEPTFRRNLMPPSSGFQESVN